jgi:hypothetical protein
MKVQLLDPKMVSRVVQGGGTFSSLGDPLTHSFLLELEYLRSCPFDTSSMAGVGSYASDTASLTGRYQAVEFLNQFAGADLDPFDSKAIQAWWDEHKREYASSN